MNTKKRVLINVGARGRADYSKGSLRLIDSAIKHNINSDIIVFSPELENQSYNFGDNSVTIIKGLPITEKFGACPSHSDQKYLFKAYAIQYAIEQGYENILWCDSSIVLHKNPEHHFELLKEIGTVLFDNPGCTIGTYTAKSCIDRIGIPHHKLDRFECDAGIMLFNVERSKDILNDYFNFCLDGICLNGADNVGYEGYKAHRHDQSIISLLAIKHNIPFVRYGAWGYSWDENLKEACFVKTGI